MPTVEEAADFFRKENYPKALEVLSELLKADPANQQILHDRALCLYLLKDYKNAAIDASKLNKEESTNKKLLNAIAKKLEPKKPIKDKSPAALSKYFHSDIAFKDVIGMEKEIKYMKENIMLPLKDPELYRTYKKRIGASVILYGPPGCGKTWITRGLAGEANANMRIVNQSEMLNLYVGETEKNVHNLFEDARKHTPCILFFDEFESLTSKRGGSKVDQTEMNVVGNVISTLLAEIDGINKNPEGLFLIGATNRPWDIDSAFKRPGRFGDSLYIRAPNQKDREKLFAYYLKDVHHATISLTKLAWATEGYTNTDIAQIVDKAKLRPILESQKTGIKRPLTLKDLQMTIKEKMPKTSVDEWYITTRKELLGGVKTYMADGQIKQSFESGKLEADEKPLYSDLIQDMEKRAKKSYFYSRKVKRYLGMLP